MVESRWFRRAGPAVAALGAIALIATTTLGAPGRAWTPEACAGAPRIGAPAPGTVVPDRSGPRRRARGPASAWSWVAPAIAGTRALDLDAESFAAGPFGGTTLVGTDDGRRSRLSLVDAARGCAWSLVASRRRHPDRDARAGWRVALRIPRRPADARRPRRLATGPRWLDRAVPRPGPDRAPTIASGRPGPRISSGARTAGRSPCSRAARSRAASASSTRATAACALVADPALGDVVGLDGDRLVAHGACRGLPCPLLSVDIATGSDARPRSTPPARPC